MNRINQYLRYLPIWVVYLLGMVPALWLFVLAVQGQLGVDPVKVLEHRYGELALQFLIATLGVTPLRRFIALNLLKFRRALGLLSFFYVVCHLFVWLILDVQILSQILNDIAKRPYITVGMVAFLAMVPLAVTSTNRMIRRLGPAWRQIHKLTYVVAILAALHFVLLAKGFQIEPLIYLGLVAGLIGLRVFPKTGTFRLKFARTS